MTTLADGKDLIYEGIATRTAMRDVKELFS